MIGPGVENSVIRKCPKYEKEECINRKQQPPGIMLAVLSLANCKESEEPANGA
jgi:hypothetical protein